jgi:hypothetical protein
MHLFYLAGNLALLLATAWSITIPEKRASAACNGHPELCDRSYGNITYVGGELPLQLSSTHANRNIQHMIRLRIAKILLLVRYTVSLSKFHGSILIVYFSGS